MRPCFLGDAIQSTIEPIAPLGCGTLRRAWVKEECPITAPLPTQMRRTDAPQTEGRRMMFDLV
jgi:hypothetical protein